jgi:hypothetical protein
MILDNSVVHFNPSSYHYMDKGKEKDFEQCQEAWNKNIVGEWMNRGIKNNGDGSYVKQQKRSTSTDLEDCKEDKEEDKPN